MTPNAVVIIGNGNQLTDAKMKEDVRILRGALTNVEVVRYDELLDRLKNQLEMVGVDPEIKLDESPD